MATTPDQRSQPEQYSDGAAQQTDRSTGATGQLNQSGQTAAVQQQGQPPMMFGGQPMMAAGQQGGRIMMIQPMVMGQQGGEMTMGQPMMMGQQGGQMMMGQPMMMGQQGGQMMMGQPMMMVMEGQQAAGPWQMQGMKPAQMQMSPMGQLPQVQMTGAPMGQTVQMAYPQMYPPQAGAMYSSAQGGMVIMGSPFFHPPNLRYTPISYLWLSYFTMVVFGLLFPLSLLFSVPAVVLARKSENSTRDGDICKAKSRSTVAVYLNFGAIVFAFLASDLILGLVLGLYRRPRYYG